MTYNSLVMETTNTVKQKSIERFDIEGDIIITDPCYIKKYVHTTHNQDTYYGDWGCHVWETDETFKPSDDAETIGEFCADAAEVCVTDIRNAHDPDGLEKYLSEHSHVAFVLRGFKGIIEYVTNTVFFEYNGELLSEDVLIINGKGTVNGKPFCFTTRQTSL